MFALAALPAALMLDGLTMLPVSVLGLARRLSGGGGCDRKRERGNEDLHVVSPENMMCAIVSQASRGGGGSDPGAVPAKKGAGAMA